MNIIESIATVSTRPLARRAATMPAAMSIWLSTQPPKIWPLALMSPGRGMTLRIGSCSLTIPVLAAGGSVMARAVAEEDQSHRRGPEHHRKSDSRHCRDQHRDRHRSHRDPEIDEC